MKHAPLTDSELNRIYKALISKEHKIFFCIARYTGANFEDILRLKIGDVYDNELAPLEKITFTRFNGKTREMFTVPILEEKLIRFRPKVAKSDSWLFPSPILEGEHIKSSACDKWFRAALLSCNLSDYEISPSDIKRSFIYKLHRNGISNAGILEITGRSSLWQYRKELESDPVDLREVLEKRFEPVSTVL